MLNFDEKLHRYTNDKGDIYTSATQIIEHYTPHFEEEFWLYYKVLQDKAGFEDNDEGKKLYSKWLTKGYGFSFKYKTIEALQEIAEKIGVDISDVSYKKEEWRKKNKKSTDKGTKFHNMMEAKALSEGKGTLDDGTRLIYKSYNGGLENTNFGENGVEGIPELRLYNHKYKLAGTTDDPVFYPNKIVDVNDFKSNIKITTENKWEKMLYPLNKYDNCNYVHYNIQLSLYGWMLEQFGYKVRNLQITHYLFNEQEEPIASKVYKFEYLKEDIEKMLNHYVNHKGQNHD